MAKILVFLLELIWHVYLSYSRGLDTPLFYRAEIRTESTIVDVFGKMAKILVSQGFAFCKYPGA